MYDVVIIGGGIAGIGAAGEIRRALPDKSVLVLEKAEFLSAASQNSLRVIHGGFRYLQTFDIQRIFKSLKARATVLSNYSDSTARLGCMMPLNPWGPKSRYPVLAAVCAYRMLMSLGGYEWSYNTEKVVGKDVAESMEKILKGHVEHGALFWTDGQITDQELFFKTLLKELEENSVELKSQCSVSTFGRSSDHFEVVYSNEGGEKSVQARAVINTSSYGSERIDTSFNARRIQSKWCTGYNIVTDKKLVDKHAVALPGPGGRLFFITPRTDGSAIGTWYAGFTDTRSEIESRDRLVEDFLSEFCMAMPEAGLSSSDITGVEAGVLPEAPGTEIQPVTKEYFIKTGLYYEVQSAKLTTFQEVGRELAESLKKTRVFSA